MSPDRNLVEFVELDRELHPFFVATQAHPEFKSRPTRPHPLFFSFVEASLDYLKGERLPIDADDDRRRTPRPRPWRSAATPVGVATVTEPGVFDVVASETVFDGKIVQVRVDQVRMPGGGVAARETVGHDRAVAVVALDERSAGGAGRAVPASDPPPAVGAAGRAARRGR